MDDLIIPALEQWAAELTRDEAARILRDAGQPARRSCRPSTRYATPSISRARGLFQDLDDPRAVREDGTRLKLPRLPLLFDGEGAIPGPIPKLGEHNDELGGRST